ncbi:MAG TPA: phosphotransferase [Microlunatus sp.]
MTDDELPARVSRLDPETMLAELNRRTGAGMRLLGRADHGEVGAAFVSWPDGREGVLTRSAAAMQELERIGMLLGRAADAGLPVPRYQTIVDLGTDRAIVQQRLPGSVPSRVDDALVEQLVEVADQWAGQGFGAPELDLHLSSSGPGFCLHETLANYQDRSRLLLQRVREIGRSAGIEEGDDLVHLDFHPANVLVADGRISGVIDWDGIGRGDRRAAYVTLTFDLSFGSQFRPEYDGLGGGGWKVVLGPLARAPIERVRRWWAHMALRQVDWTIRHGYPSEVIDFYLDLGSDGLDVLAAEPADLVDRLHRLCDPTGR